MGESKKVILERFRNKYREQGLCHECSEHRPRDPRSKNYCTVCLEKAKLRAGTLRKKWISLGLCASCNLHNRIDFSKSKVYCSECFVKNSERHELRKKEWNIKGLCAECRAHRPLEVGKATCSVCLEKSAKTNRVVQKKWQALGRCYSCPEHNVIDPRSPLLCSKCYTRHLFTSKERTLSIKKDVLMAYGGCECKACGETDLSCLCIDHVFNDGSEERKNSGKPISLMSGHNWYFFLKRNNFPNKNRYQVLCMNCNFRKQLNGGVLPKDIKWIGVYKEVASREDSWVLKGNDPFRNYDDVICG